MNEHEMYAEVDKMNLCEMLNEMCSDCCADCGGCMRNVVCSGVAYEEYCSTGSECEGCGDTMEYCTDWCTCKDDEALVVITKDEAIIFLTRLLKEE